MKFHGIEGAWSYSPCRLVLSSIFDGRGYSITSRYASAAQLDFIRSSDANQVGCNAPSVSYSSPRKKVLRGAVYLLFLQLFE